MTFVQQQMGPYRLVYRYDTNQSVIGASVYENDNEILTESDLKDIKYHQFLPDIDQERFIHIMNRTVQCINESNELIDYYNELSDPDKEVYDESVYLEDTLEQLLSELIDCLQR